MMKDLTISGGQFAITTYGGYNASYDKNNDSYPSAKGLKASGSYTPEGSTEEVDATGCTLTISGGVFSLNTADDAVHSDGSVAVTGGTFYILTGDDGVHANNALTLGISGGSDSDVKITIASSYEGLEGADIDIYSGSYNVTSSDDSINAAGGSSNGSDTGTQDNFGPGGNRPGSTGNTVSGDYSLNIMGGNVLVNAEGDGLDSNGTISLTCGTIVVWGQKSGGDNAPLDCDGTLTISGATVFAAGSSAMAGSVSGSSNQTAIVTSSSSNGPSFGGSFSSSGNFSASAGQTINVTDDNSIIYSIQAVKSVNYALYSAPDLTSSSGSITVSGNAGTVTEDICDHDWTEVSSTATCGETGEAVFICTICGETKTETAAATGVHSYVLTSSTANCEEGGEALYTCTVCGDTKTESAPASGEHVWNEGEAISEATCTEDGETIYTCTICGETKTETVQSTGEHTWDEETGKCSVCGTVAYAIAFEADEHVTVTVYKTQNTALESDSNGKYFARNSDSGLIDISGDGQINFTVTADDG